MSSTGSVGPVLLLLPEMGGLTGSGCCRGCCCQLGSRLCAGQAINPLLQQCCPGHRHLAVQVPIQMGSTLLGTAAWANLVEQR